MGIFNLDRIARVISDPDGNTGEFSILIGDPWHGQGIGAKLFGRVLQIAQNREMETVRGIVLRENRKMIALGKRLGFTPRTEADPGEITLEIILKRRIFHF